MPLLKIINLWLAALALLLLPKAIVADSFVYERILTLRTLYAISSGSKLVFLAAATGFGFLVRSSFAPGNPARRGWTGLAWGFGGYLAGQGYLAYYEIGQGLMPYPSPADVFFLAGQIFLVGASLSFLAMYRSLGLGFDRAAKIVWTVTGFGAFAIVTLILRPLALQSTPLVEKAFNLGYPLLDGVLIVLATALFVQTWRLRGGGLWRTWRFLVAGFLFSAAGDICFAYSGVFGFAVLDPIFDFLFACSYAFLALGVHSQWKLQAGESAA